MLPSPPTLKGLLGLGVCPARPRPPPLLAALQRSPRAGGTTPFSLRGEASSWRSRTLRSARAWEGALNAAPRLPSSELALNRLLLPLHLLRPREHANFTRSSGFSLLPSSRGKRPAGRGQWSLGKVDGAKAPDGGPSGRSPAQAWALSAAPASVTLQAGRAVPTHPLCGPEQPVPPSRAVLSACRSPLTRLLPAPRPRH